MRDERFFFAPKFLGVGDVGARWIVPIVQRPSKGDRLFFKNRVTGGILAVRPDCDRCAFRRITSQDEAESALGFGWRILGHPRDSVQKLGAIAGDGHAAA